MYAVLTKEYSSFGEYCLRNRTLRTCQVKISITIWNVITPIPREDRSTVELLRPVVVVFIKDMNDVIEICFYLLPQESQYNSAFSCLDFSLFHSIDAVYCHAVRFLFNQCKGF